MRQFHYEAIRSTKPADQVPGLVCASFDISGSAAFPGVEAAFEYLEKLLLIPGVWRLKVSAGPLRWRTFSRSKTVDTRPAEVRS